MTRMLGFGLAGIVLGACVGYALGPTVPVLGVRLPFVTVLTLGGDLSGMDRMLLGDLASRAGTFLYGGAVFLGIGGAALGRSTRAGRTGPPSS